MSSIANRHVSSIDLLKKYPIFLQRHLLSNQNEECNDCGFPKKYWYENDIVLCSVCSRVRDSLRDRHVNNCVVELSR